MGVNKKRGLLSSERQEDLREILGSAKAFILLILALALAGTWVVMAFVWLVHHTVAWLTFAWFYSGFTSLALTFFVLLVLWGFYILSVFALRPLFEEFFERTS